MSAVRKTRAHIATALAQHSNRNRSEPKCTTRRNTRTNCSRVSCPLSFGKLTLSAAGLAIGIIAGVVYYRRVYGDAFDWDIYNVIDVFNGRQKVGC